MSLSGSSLHRLAEIAREVLAAEEQTGVPFMDSQGILARVWPTLTSEEQAVLGKKLQMSRRVRQPRAATRLELEIEEIAATLSAASEQLGMPSGTTNGEVLAALGFDVPADALEITPAGVLRALARHCSAQDKA